MSVPRYHIRLETDGVWVNGKRPEPTLEITARVDGNFLLYADHAAALSALTAAATQACEALERHNNIESGAVLYDSGLLLEQHRRESDNECCAAAAALSAALGRKP